MSGRPKPREGRHSLRRAVCFLPANGIEWGSPKSPPPSPFLRAAVRAPPRTPRTIAVAVIHLRPRRLLVRVPGELAVPMTLSFPYPSRSPRRAVVCRSASRRCSPSSRCRPHSKPRPARGPLASVRWPAHQPAQTGGKADGLEYQAGLPAGPGRVEG